MKIATFVVPSVALLVLASALSARAETNCEMNFHLEGWSAFYKTSHGGGRLTCDNGQSARVVLHTRGGGITFGRSKIVDGRGKFSPVSNIHELFGDYASAEAHAGVGESKDAAVVTKGTVSLALTGEGHGVDIGFSFGRFTIEPAPARRPSKDAEIEDEQRSRREEAPHHSHVEETPLDDAPAPRSDDPPPAGRAY
jgi:hypothetical protein